MPGVRARGGGAGPAPREAAVDPPGMPEPAPGGAEAGTGTRTPHVAGVAPDGIQEQRRRGGRRTAPAGGMAQRGRRPSRPRDGRTVLLVGQMHGGAHAARTGNAHGIRGPVGRGPGRSIGRKGMDRIAGLTGWRGPRPWTMDPAMTDTGEDHTLEGMWPEPGPGVDDEWRADLDHDDGAGPRAVDMDRIIEGIWRGPSRTQRRGPRMVVPRRRGQAMSDRPGTTGATSEWPRPGRYRMDPVPHPQALVWADGYCSAQCRRPGAQGGTGTGAGRPLPHVWRTRVQAARDPCPTSAPTGAATGGTGSPAPGQVPAHGDHATNAAHGSIPAREANTAATHAARHMTTRRRAIGARCAPPPTPEPSKGSE